MTDIILQRKCVISGKHLDIGSLITVTDVQAETLIKFGYAIKRLPKQDVFTGETKQTELQPQGHKQMQELSASQDVQTAIPKGKTKRKTLDVKK